MDSKPTTPTFVAPPGESRRDSVSERRSAAHQQDPAWRWQHQPRDHDLRSEISAVESAQRNRARQMELRNDGQSHVRVPRRRSAQG